jgi:hypothetical protein
MEYLRAFYHLIQIRKIYRKVEELQDFQNKRHIDIIGCGVKHRVFYKRNMKNLIQLKQYHAI